MSDKVSCNYGKEYRYIVGYQANGVTVPLFIKTPKNVLQYDKNSAYTMSFDISEEKEWVPQFKKIWNEVESQSFEKKTIEPIKREGTYANGKLKTCKECIKTNFHSQDLPYNMHFNAMSVLKIDSVYKQGKNYHPQVNVEECKYTNAEKQQRCMLSDDDDDDDDDDDEFFEV